MSDPNVPPPPGGTPPPPPPPGGGTPPPPPGPPPGTPPPPPGGFGTPPPGGPPPPGGIGGPPGGFTPPPAQPYGGGGEYPQLDVGSAISYGWKKFTENVGAFIILMLAVVVIGLVLSVVRFVLTPDSSGFMALLWTSLMSTVIYVILWIVQAGVWRAGLGVTRGETPSVAQLTQTDNIVPYILTILVVGVVAFVGFLLCFIPGIIWMIFTAYAPLLALDKGLGPVEAIKGSIDWVKDNFGQVFLILLVSYVIYIIGACLCGVGLLVSAPVALVAIVYSYRALNNETVVA
jgi:hypothetical protein